MKRQIFWLFVLNLLAGFTETGSAQSVIGQPQYDYSPKSPAVAAMQQAIDVPVSYFTGAANISIPLHTAHSKSIQIPLELNYQTGGIKAEQYGTYVGLGWALKAGGMISRTVRGNPDEGIAVKTIQDSIVYINVTTGYRQVQYFWNTPVDSLANAKHIQGGFYVDGGNNTDIIGISNDIKTHNRYVTTNTRPEPPSVSDWMFLGLNDDGPDLFYYNMGDYSGKFFFGRGQVPILVPYNKDIKITPVFVPGVGADKYTYNYFSAWTISTPDGLIYYFGGTPGSLGNSVISATQNRQPNSWALTKIVNTITKDSVLFSYIGGGVTTFKNTNIQHSILQYDFNNCAPTVNLITAEGFGDPTISRIQTRTELVNFYYGGKLDSVVIRDVSTLLPYKKIQLSYNYFLSGKLKLTEALIMNYQHTQVLPYTFKYYDTAFQKKSRPAPFNDSIPFFSLYSQDFWGYYNDAYGNDHNSSMLITAPSCSAATNRHPAWPQMQRDALTEIVYPTGGKTKLIYEPHTASYGRMTNGQLGDFETWSCDENHNFSLENTIGGLRIKSIEQIDPLTNDTLIKTFDYSSKVFGPAHSSGFLYIAPSLIANITDGFNCNGNQTNKPKFMLSTNNMATGSAAGLHVTYTNVTVAQQHNGVQNGYTEYEYYDDTNTDPSCFFNICDSVHNFCAVNDPDVLLPWQEKRPLENLLAGNLKATRTYDNSGHMLKHERDSYLSIVYPGITRVLELSMILSTDLCDNLLPPLAYVYMPPQDRELLPAPSSYMFMHTFAIGKMSVLPKQRIVDTYDTTGNKVSDTTSFFYESPNHISQTSVRSTASNSDSLLTQTIYSFDLSDVNGADSTGLQMKNAYLNVPVASFNSRNNKIVNGGYLVFGRTSLQDPKSILRRQEYRLTTSAGLNQGDLNLTPAYPKTLSFPPTLFQQAATFGYDADNNIILVVAKGADTSAFLWDYNNTALVAKVANAGPAAIGYTGFESTNDGNWIVPSTSRNSQAFTGLKSYSLSSGNITLSLVATGKKMVVSYWAIGGSALVNGSTTSAGVTRNGWTYYEHSLPATTNAITVSGSVIIDELRLYPSTSQMTTYAYTPLLGVTAITGPDSRSSYYEYDSLQRLRVIRDADRNILKLADYQYAGFNTTVPVWRATGQLRCKPCALNAAFNSDTLQMMLADMNNKSSTFNSLQWVDTGKSSQCPIVASWINTSTATRCRLDANGQGTGYQDQEQIDQNPCSSTYNATRWVPISFNTVCLACQGTDRKILRGVCEIGVRVNTASVLVTVGGAQQYKCTYHLEWSDCSKSADTVQYSNWPCTITISCSQY